MKSVGNMALPTTGGPSLLLPTADMLLLVVGFVAATVATHFR